MFRGMPVAMYAAQHVGGVSGRRQAHCRDLDQAVCHGRQGTQTFEGPHVESPRGCRCGFTHSLSKPGALYYIGPYSEKRAVNCPEPGSIQALRNLKVEA